MKPFHGALVTMTGQAPARERTCAQCAFWLRILLWATRRARLR
jgi:hypothetical protein